MGFLDKIFGNAKDAVVEEEAVMDETVEIADEAAALPTEVTEEEMMDESMVASNVDMDADNLD